MDDFFIKRFILTMDPILIVLLISKIRNVKVGDQVPPEKRGGYRPMWHCRFHHPCFGLWFRKGWIHKPYTIEFSGGDTSAIPCPGWVCGVMGGATHLSCHAMPRMSMRSYGGRHICHAQDESAELWNNKRLQLEFSKQSLSFFDKNKKWMPCHSLSSHSSS